MENNRMPESVKKDRSGLPMGQYFRGCDDTVGSFLLRVQALFPHEPPALQRDLANECWRRRMQAEKAKALAETLLRRAKKTKETIKA